MPNRGQGKKGQPCGVCVWGGGGGGGGGGGIFNTVNRGEGYIYIYIYFFQSRNKNKSICVLKEHSIFQKGIENLLCFVK